MLVHAKRRFGGYSVLLVLWALLAARIGLALLRGEPLGGDLALPTLALFVSSTILGSRVYALVAFRSLREEPSLEEK